MSRIMAVDPAYTGADKTCVAVREDRLIMPLHYRAKMDTTEGARWVMTLQRKYMADFIVVDVVGWGAGVFDQLNHAGFPVVPFNGARGTRMRDVTGTLGFNNLRSAYWWRLREALDPSLTNSTPLMIPDDSRLVGDLTAPRWYELAGGKIALEPKDKIRERIGRSPDAGDAVSMTLYEPPRIQPVKIGKAITIQYSTSAR